MERRAIQYRSQYLDCFRSVLEEYTLVFDIPVVLYLERLSRSVPCLSEKSIDTLVIYSIYCHQIAFVCTCVSVCVCIHVCGCVRMSTYMFCVGWGLCARACVHSCMCAQYVLEWHL